MGVALVRLDLHRASCEIKTIREAAVKMGWHVPNNPRRAAEVIAGSLVQIALLMEPASNAARLGKPRCAQRRTKRLF